MTLWIRSQDKKCLIKTNIIEYENYTGAILKGATDIDSNYHTLGKYKTKGRALEVLDEIQEHIKWLATLSYREREISSYRPEVIYQMPEE